MSGAPGKAQSHKRGRNADGGDDEMLRTDAHTPMAVPAAAAAPAAESVAAASATMALSPAVHAAAGAPVPDPTSSASSVEVTQPAQTIATTGVEPLPEQFSRRKKPRRSARLACYLNQLAVVELQLCLQFLDTTSKLPTARCSRRLMQAVDHPFAWQGPNVSVNSRNQLQLGSLIHSSLLRNAPIALQLDRHLPAAEVAAIPRLCELGIPSGSSDLAEQLWSLSSLQGLQTLRVQCSLPDSALQLLPTLPALHSLQCCVLSGSAAWSWLPAMPAVTDLDLLCVIPEPLSQPLIDGIGQCTQLQSLRLEHPSFGDGAFARFCSTSALRKLRHLTLDSLCVLDDKSNVEEFRAAFSALAALESLRIDKVPRVDLLLAQLAHAPALRTLTIPCEASRPQWHMAWLPSHEVLRQLLTAAPRLEVKLHVATIDVWRLCYWYCAASTPAVREQMDDQWRELQRIGEDMERVTIVRPYGKYLSVTTEHDAAASPSPLYSCRLARFPLLAVPGRARR